MKFVIMPIAQISQSKAFTKNTEAKTMRFQYGLILAFIFGCSLFYPRDASAVSFGKKEEIRFVEALLLKSERGEPLYLGYKLTSHHFLASYSLEEDGYVIGVAGNSDRYYPMPTPEKLNAFQKMGLMPTPLPQYHLVFRDYIFGYLLWMVIPIVTLWIWLDGWQRRRSRKNNSVNPTQVLVHQHQAQYQQKPIDLPMLLIGKSLFSGGNNLHIDKAGFAFTSMSGTDLTYWPDVSGFSLSQFNGKVCVSWRYSQEFRGLSTAQVIESKLGMSQIATLHSFEKSAEEIVGILNATWMQRREKI
jgi:hypothetical protein